MLLLSRRIVAHLIQAIRSKHWYLFWTLVLGATSASRPKSYSSLPPSRLFSDDLSLHLAVETLGWACRAWAADSTFWVEKEGGFWTSSGDAFLAQ
jgi:hypothetical protein